MRESRYCMETLSVSRVRNSEAPLKLAAIFSTQHSDNGDDLLINVSQKCKAQCHGHIIFINTFIVEDHVMISAP